MMPLWTLKSQCNSTEDVLNLSLMRMRQYCMTIRGCFFTNVTIKQIVHSEWTFSYLFTHTPFQTCDFLSPVEWKRRCFAQCSLCSFLRSIYWILILKKTNNMHVCIKTNVFHAESRTVYKYESRTEAMNKPTQVTARGNGKLVINTLKNWFGAVGFIFIYANCFKLGCKTTFPLFI